MNEPRLYSLYHSLEVCSHSIADYHLYGWCEGKNVYIGTSQAVNGALTLGDVQNIHASVPNLGTNKINKIANSQQLSQWHGWFGTIDKEMLYRNFIVTRLSFKVISILSWIFRLRYPVLRGYFTFFFRFISIKCHSTVRLWVPLCVQQTIISNRLHYSCWCSFFVNTHIYFAQKLCQMVNLLQKFICILKVRVKMASVCDEWRRFCAHLYGNILNISSSPKIFAPKTRTINCQINFKFAGRMLSRREEIYIQCMLMSLTLYARNSYVENTSCVRSYTMYKCTSLDDKLYMADTFYVVYKIC